jgi:hypothetical protein
MPVKRHDRFLEQTREQKVKAIENVRTAFMILSSGAFLRRRRELNHES